VYIFTYSLKIGCLLLASCGTSRETNNGLKWLRQEHWRACMNGLMYPPFP